MRNLKKILALVLALVMSFSVMTVSSAAFKDEADIAANYAESIEVLNYIGVFRGDEKGNFNPKGSITRAEVAAIIYRITTGDTTDTQAGFYADLEMFTDVPATEWYAGYVNYCASAQYIKGRGNGTFGPTDKITGYDALTMILRAIGRDQDGEFTGEYYTVKVAEIAKACGITDTLTGVALGAPATREVIAEILFNTINVPQFEYTLAFGYSNYLDPLQQTKPTETLGYEMFKLWNDADDKVYGAGYDYVTGENLDHDGWGVPFYYGWFIDAHGDKEVSSIYDEIITTIDAPVLYETYEAEYECDIAKAMNLKKDAAFALVTENGTDVTGACSEFDGTINLTATKKLVGEQGRWTRIYVTVNGYEMVMMDEFLAEVTDVTKVTYDRNGHIKAYATVTLNIYDESWASHGVSRENLAGSTITWYSKTDFDFAEGELVLLYHAADENGFVNQAENDLCDVIGAPSTLNAYQPGYVHNRNSHLVGESEYPDAFRLNIDEAGLNTDREWTWIFDSNNNIIGSMEIKYEAAYQYGVITAIKWVDEYNNLNDGYALANVTYIDGTTGTIRIAAIDNIYVEGIEGNHAELNAVIGQDKDGKDVIRHLVSSTKQYNKDLYTYNHLYQIATYYGYAYLEECDTAPGAGTSTGVSEMGDSKYFATHETLFLVLTYDAYGRPVFTNYNGIDEIPNYTNGKGDYYVVADKKNVCDYVFINTPELFDNSKYYNNSWSFFSYENDRLTVTHTLNANNEFLYTVSGGLINGEPASFNTLDFDVVQFVLDNQGVMLNLMYNTQYNLVYGVDYIFETPVKLYSIEAFASYAGEAKDAYIKGGVLFTVVNGETIAYNIEDANVVTEYLDLEDTLTFAEKSGLDAHFYVIWTKNYNEKSALTVVIANQGYTADEFAANEALDAAVAAADIEELVYTVEADADVKAVITEEVKKALVADEDLAALIADGAVVTVRTGFDFEAATEETNTVAFLVEVEYNNAVVRKSVVIKVTVKVAETAEDAE